MSVSNISKSFDRRTILKNVSFTLNEGETVVIMGKNGAGKSTLLRILARIMACDKGEIFFLNNDLLKGSPSVRRKLLYLGHAPAMYTTLSAIENLKLALTLRGTPMDISRIQDQLKYFGLSAQSDDPISIYSQGMLQRLKLAYAELADWDLLLIDEPFSGLDTEGIELVETALHRWKELGKSIIMVLHSLSRAEEFGDRILHIQNGLIE
ncbi:MAG: ABC transporter ATP-binding protein [Candidatus Marinimicrobia bacterium]|nr:ABC transporter ATP-binding protein [Candidatus Neomarinimicrobiota bacterium]MBL7010001.1 ABC transporter ATP-binding protein [Candidatus Neomarinimicrobiota bacterium]